MTAHGSDLQARRPHDAVRRLIGPVLAPLYGLAVRLRNARFDRGIGVARAAVPVVSVGNLTVGGTGKTPVVVWLCRELIARGVSPAIALRGYGASTNSGRSDEAEEYRAAVPGVPVIVNPDRLAGIAAHVRDGGRPGVVLLDDGFQHRRLHRDLDIVLVDAMAATHLDCLLPAGDLREPLTGVQRAGVLLLTHADDQARAAQVERALRPLCASDAVLARAVHRWSEVLVLEAGGTAARPVMWLTGRRTVVVCGLGRPERFLRQLREAGCTVQFALTLKDHGPIDDRAAATVAAAAARHAADTVVMTQKDFSRMAQVPHALRALAIARPVLELDVRPGGRVVDRVLAAIRGSGGTEPTMAR